MNVVNDADWGVARTYVRSRGALLSTYLVGSFKILMFGSMAIAGIIVMLQGETLLWGIAFALIGSAIALDGLSLVSTVATVRSDTLTYRRLWFRRTRIPWQDVTGIDIWSFGAWRPKYLTVEFHDRRITVPTGSLHNPRRLHRYVIETARRANPSVVVSPRAIEECGHPPYGLLPERPYLAGEMQKTQ